MFLYNVVPSKDDTEASDYDEDDDGAPGEPDHESSPVSKHCFGLTKRTEWLVYLPEAAVII